MGRSVQANTVYDDLTNVKGELVRTYGIRDILNRSVVTKKSRVIHVNHLQDDTDDIPKLVAYLDSIGYNGGIDYNEKKQDIIVGVGGKSKIQIRFILQKLSGGGRQQVPTDVQEKGTTVIFNRALRDNVKFRHNQLILSN